MPDLARPKVDNEYDALMNRYLHTKIKTITQTIVKILKICYFDTLWECLGMSDHAHLKTDNENAALSVKKEGLSFVIFKQ